MSELIELRREFPKRERRPIAEDLDEHGDVVFRFKLTPREDAEALTLREFYRESVADLLRIVRFYAGGQPIIVDAFAFLNAPNDPIPILPPAASEQSVERP